MKRFDSEFSVALRLVSALLAFSAFSVGSMPINESHANSQFQGASLEPKDILTMNVGRIQKDEKLEVFTSRQVKIGYLVEQVLFRGEKGSEIQVPSIDSKAFVQEVSSFLMESAVFREAQSFSAARISTDEVDAAVKNVREALSGLDAWEKLGVGGDELRKVIQMKLRAKKFIQFKANSSVIPITEGEARRYFERNKAKFGDAPFEQFSDQIKSVLKRERVDSRLKEWFRVLRSKYDIRNSIATN